MKSIRTAFSIFGLGLLLSLAACNSNKSGEAGSADSADMDNTQSQMETDTMATDSMGADTAKPL